MKLEVGMYYRYKGQIGKYKKITELDRYPSFTNNYLRENETILLNNAKFSYNIIDILKKGDYVNGIEVINIDDEWITMSDTQVPILKSIANGLIKTIVTKEQFESMSYKLED